MKIISDQTALICQAALVEVERTAEGHAAAAARCNSPTAANWIQLVAVIKKAAAELAAA